MALLYFYLLLAILFGSYMSSTVVRMVYLEDEFDEDVFTEDEEEREEVDSMAYQS